MAPIAPSSSIYPHMEPAFCDDRLFLSGEALEESTVLGALSEPWPVQSLSNSL